MLLSHPAISPADQIKALKSFLWLTQFPAEFEAIYDLDEVLRKTEISDISCAYLRAQPGVAQLMQERYLGPTPNLDELLTLPKDSLGYLYAIQLKVNNFEPVFYRQREVQDDISYLSLRRSQTHDIHHVVTGFGTDLAGEIALQAFQLAQMRSPLAIALMSSAVVYALNSPDLLNNLMTQMHQGWEMGMRTQPFFAQKWEEHWEKPLAIWQAELGVVS